MTTDTITSPDYRTVKRYATDQNAAVTKILTQAWTEKTSSNPDWSTENPALGQCAVSALYVQAIFGGDLIRVVNGDVSHYYNRLSNGLLMDTTREQFVTWNPSIPEIRTREYVLSYPATKDRYLLLLENILRLEKTFN